MNIPISVFINNVPKNYLGQHWLGNIWEFTILFNYMPGTTELMTDCKVNQAVPQYSL